MEIFIIGGLIVALMVFISTKVKASAARAFVPEFIERDEFEISKPQGFMTPLEYKPEYKFEAYSRNFGEKKTRNIWQAHALLTASDNLSFEAERKRIKNSAGKIASERILKDETGDAKICLLEYETKIDEISMIVFRKIVESRARRKTYDLKISVLPTFRAEYIESINEMINSFRLK